MGGCPASSGVAGDALSGRRGDDDILKFRKGDFGWSEKSATEICWMTRAIFVY